MKRVTKYFAGIAVAGLLMVGMVACAPEESSAPAAPIHAQPGAATTASPPIAAPPSTSAPEAATPTFTSAAASGSAEPTAAGAPAATARPSPTDLPAVAPTGPTSPATGTPSAPAAPTETPVPPPPAAATDAPAIAVGNQVGETPPAFAMDLADGSRIESADIVGTGKPVFMMYFATW